MEYALRGSGNDRDVKNTELQNHLARILTSFVNSDGSKFIGAFTPIGTGLIHSTWKVLLHPRCCIGKDGEPTHPTSYILQQVNTHVFPNADKLTENINAITEYLSINFADNKTPGPLRTVTGNFVIHCEHSESYRMFPFIEGSHVHQTVSSCELAYEASKQFARFSKSLQSFDLEKLYIALPGFHDLSQRYVSFEQCIHRFNTQISQQVPNANFTPGRELENVNQATKYIRFLTSLKGEIVGKFHYIVHSPAFKLRVMHHDTKISNVLFTAEGRGLCVIDLDTVMPGYFISDVGDMIRTYVCPVDENEKDYSQIRIREEILYAIVKGYRSELGATLSVEENAPGSYIYAGKFMLYMQAVRFLSDYMDGDLYYPVSYPTHNLVRAGNQIILLQQLIEKENEYCAHIANME